MVPLGLYRQGYVQLCCTAHMPGRQGGGGGSGGEGGCLTLTCTCRGPGPLPQAM